MLEVIFCKIDDFCKYFEKKSQSHMIGKSKKVGRKRLLTTSEVLTITVYFHASGYKNFKQYYNVLIRGFLQSAFPLAPSYNRFIELRQESAFMLALFTQTNAVSDCDGISIIDSCKLEVCHVKREYSHKVFKGLAQKGRTSVDWFYGFKLHFVINRNGEIISFFISPGNIHDANPKALERVTKNLFGKLLGDRGYIGAFKMLYEKGIHLIHRIRKNMKNKLMNMYDKLLLRKRGVIESVINILKSKYSLEYTGLRSLSGFFSHVCASIAAYSFKSKKPSIFYGECPKIALN